MATRAVAITPEGHRAVSGGLSHKLGRIWDLDIPQRAPVGHAAAISALAVTQDGCRVVSSSWNKTLQVWDLKKAETLRKLEGHTNGVYAVAVMPYGRRAVSGGYDQTLRVWDLETGQILHTLAADERFIVSTGVSDSTLGVWDLEGGPRLRALQGHTGSVFAVTVTPDCRRAVSA